MLMVLCTTQNPLVIQDIYLECNIISLGMFDMCELRLNMSALVSNLDLYP